MESYKGQHKRIIKFSEMPYDHLENALGYFVRKRNDLIENPIPEEEEHFKKLMRISLIISMISNELAKREEQYAK